APATSVAPPVPPTPPAPSSTPPPAPATGAPPSSPMPPAPMGSWEEPRGPRALMPPSTDTSESNHDPQAGEPPLAPAPGPVQLYQVRGGKETLRDIARRTLGSSDRWTDIYKL